MAGKGSYLGGSSIIRPTAKPSISWAEEHDFVQGRHDILSNAQIVINTRGFERRLLAKPNRSLVKAATSQSWQLVNQCSFPAQHDPTRAKLVTNLIMTELAALFIEMTIDLKGPFFEERRQRWLKIAKNRARLLWKQQIVESA